MKKMWTIILSLALVIAVVSNSQAEKAKTADATDNLLTDNVYGYTFEKNDNWKFKTNNENSKNPEFFRFEIQKKNSQIPLERKFSPETWNTAYGSFFVDTTSLTLKQMSALFQEKNNKQRLIKNIGKKTDLINSGEFAEEKDRTFGKIGLGCVLTFKEAYDVQIRDVKDDYNIITDYLIGDVYFTIYGGKIFGFFFVAERAEYGVCKLELEKMIDTIALPGALTTEAPADSQCDSATTKTE